MSVEPEQDVPVEYDDEGLSTGVEAEQEGPEDLIEEPFDPAKIDVIPRTMTVSLLLARLRRGVLDLAPDFQRLSSVWNTHNQSKLMESLLLRIPLPAFYAAEVGEENWAVVDGIQRLTAIASFVAPELIGVKPLRLRGLEYLKQYEGFAYSELPGSLQTRIDEAELIVYLIRSGTPEPVMFNIFARLNTGGRPLTFQELRHALIPGRARSLLRELAESESFLAATGRSVSPRRMADREMVLRFLAFRITDPDDYPPGGDLDGFLRTAMKGISSMPPEAVDELEEDFTRAMKSAQEIFGAHAFRKNYAGRYRLLPVNKALFEAESVALAKMSDAELDALRRRRNLVENRFMALMEDSFFQESISIATGDPRKVRFRFSAVEDMLREAAAL